MHFFALLLSDVQNKVIIGEIVFICETKEDHKNNPLSFAFDWQLKKA